MSLDARVSCKLYPSVCLHPIWHISADAARTTSLGEDAEVERGIGEGAVGDILGGDVDLREGREVCSGGEWSLRAIPFLVTSSVFIFVSHALASSQLHQLCTKKSKHILHIPSTKTSSRTIAFFHILLTPQLTPWSYSAQLS